jgi:peptide/nickel transport system substrate-binding protein
MATMLIFSVVFAVAMDGRAQQALQSIYMPIINNGPPPDRQLTVCMSQEPESLYLYDTNQLVATHVLQALYDGPYDNNTFAYQPVILTKIPSLADGDAIITPQFVSTGDPVVDHEGNALILYPGTIVRPAGCRSEDCAITYDGINPLQMDQMAVTFELIPHVSWSDGTPLTASDSIYSYNLNADPDTPASKYQVERTESYIALNDTQVLWQGLPGYLDSTYFLNFWTPLPEHIWGSYSALELLSAEISAVKPMGWGPYIIDEWIPGMQINLHKNPYYFRNLERLPKFTHLVYRFIGSDANEAIAALLAGECDILDQTIGLDSQAQLLLELEETSLIDASFTPGTVWDHADFNIQPVESIVNTGAFAGWDEDLNGDGPFGDPRLRWAIAMCMDRQAAIDQALYGQTVMMDSYVPYNHPLYNPEATHWPYNPDTASALLDEIGWLDDDQDPSTPRVAQGVTGVPDGTLLEFLYETTTATLRQQVTQILADSMAACGIHVNLVYHPASEWFKNGPEGRLFGRKFDLGEFAWLTGTIPPCELYLSSQVPRDENGWGGQNVTGFHDPAYDAACNSQLQSLPGEPDYETAILEAQRIFSEQIPSIPLFLRYKLAVTRPDMCNFIQDPTNNSEMWNIEKFDYGSGCLDK